MNDNSHSFGLFLGEFLDKAAIAMSEIATAAEDFINKTVDYSNDFQHPADAKRMEIIMNFPPDANIDKLSSSHAKQKKQVSSPKITKTKTEIANKTSKIIENKKKVEDRQKPVSSESDESDESSTEQYATQRTGKAAGFSVNHYLINEAEGSNYTDEEEEDEEEEKRENIEELYSTYSDV